MTTDLKVKLLGDMMDLREQLQAIQVRMSELTALLASNDFMEPPEPAAFTHASEPQDNASLKDEPPSRPL